jgi:hypothetical protein
VNHGDRWYDPKAGTGLRATVVHRDGYDLLEFSRHTVENSRWSSLAALRSHYASYEGSEHIDGGVRVPRSIGIIEDITVEG